MPMPMPMLTFLQVLDRRREDGRQEGGDIEAQGDPHHGVHELRLAQTVPQEDQEEREENPPPVVEAMVHPDPLGTLLLAQVTLEPE